MPPIAAIKRTSIFSSLLPAACSRVLRRIIRILPAVYRSTHSSVTSTDTFYVDSEHAAFVVTSNESTIACETPAVSQPSAGLILVNFGDETSALSTQNFTYRPDPVIQSIGNIKTFIR